MTLAVFAAPTATVRPSDRSDATSVVVGVGSTRAGSESM